MATLRFSLLVLVLAAGSFATPVAEVHARSNEDPTIAEFLSIDAGSVDIYGYVELTPMSQTVLNQTLQLVTFFAYSTDYLQSLTLSQRMQLKDNVTVLNDQFLYLSLFGRLTPDEIGVDMLHATNLPPYVIRLNNYNGKLTLNGAPVTLNPATVYGALYSLELPHLLPPPAPVSLNLAQTLVAYGHTITLQYLTQSGILASITGEGPFTLLSPNDDAWNALQPDLKTRIANQPTTLARILNLHLITSQPVPLFLQFITDGLAVPSNNFNEALTFNLPEGTYPTVNGVSFELFEEFVATNGVIHSLQRVIIPNDLDSMYSTIQTTPSLSNLTTALLNLPSFQVLFDGTIDTTFLAPTNTAFSKLPVDFVTALFSNTTKMTEFLNGLLLTAPLSIFNDSTNDQVVTTQAGSSLRINIYGEVHTLQGLPLQANLIDTSKMSSGIMYGVDEVPIPAAGSIMDILRASPQLSTTVQYLTTAGLVDVYNSAQPNTVFIPTNDAWAAYSVLDELLKDTERMQRVLNYQILTTTTGTLYTAAFGETKAYMTQDLGNTVDVGAVGNTFAVDGANITVRDISATNGVIHILNEALFPDNLFSLASYVSETNGDTLKMEGYLNLTNLYMPLDQIGDTNYTILAITDAGFDALPPGQLDAWLADLPTFTSVLEYHGFDPNIFFFGSTYQNDEILTTVNGKSVRFNSYPDAVCLQGVPIISGPKSASNGLFYTVNQVIIEPTLTGKAYLQQNADKFSVFLDLLTQTNSLADWLNEPSVTFFAPTNDAFAALSNATLDLITSEPVRLTRVLSTHFVNASFGTLFSAGLTDGMQRLSRNSDTLLIIGGSLGNSTTFQVNNVTVIQKDIGLTNGVLHVIDKVLLPENLNTISARVSFESGNMTKMSELLSSLPIYYELFDDPGNYTLFAPTNEAFAKLTSAQQADINANTQKFIDYNTLNFTFTVANVQKQEQFNQMIMTNAGVLARVNYYKHTTGAVTLEGQVIAPADYEASNGFVQGLPSVVFPPAQTILEYLASQPSLSSFYNMVERSQRAQQLNSTTPYTVYAANNAAFAALPGEESEILQGNAEQAVVGFENHISNGPWFAAGLVNGMQLQTLNDKYISVFVNANGSVVSFDTTVPQSAKVLNSSIVLSNGAIYIVDSVLYPTAPIPAPEDNRDTVVIAVSVTCSLLVLIPLIIGIVYYRSYKKRRAIKPDYEYLTLKQTYRPRFKYGALPESDS